jgi:biopolymer transport protein ExbB/TolQ
MFQNLTLTEILIKGGPVFILLILASLISIAVIFERFFAMKAIKKNTAKFLNQIMTRIKSDKIDEAIILCKENSSNIVSNMILSALERKNRSKEIIEEAIEREGSKLSIYLEKRLYLLATAGSAAPFIGLFGTVLGIINAFKSISLSDSFSPALVSNGIAEALVNTAAGLFVAVPAVVAYNYYSYKTQLYIKELEIFCSELIEIITEEQA